MLFRHSAIRCHAIIMLGLAISAALFAGCRNTSGPSAVSPVPATGRPPAETPRPTPELIPVSVWLTKADETVLLEQQPDARFEASVEADLDIYVNENHPYQQMDGFGASMTDSSAWLIGTKLAEAERHALLIDLFSPTKGIGISAVRLPMGASDFTNGPHYSYDDMPPGQTDPDLAHFSIEHDMAYIVPVMQEVLQINPELKIIASPWSLPGWMKTTDSLLKGSLLPEYYDAYAGYFVKFIEAYQAEGIPIYAITLQNEPYFEPNNYPGMRIEPEDAAILVKDHLAPAFEEAGLDTKILIWDHNWDKWDYPLTFLEDADAKSQIDGVAFHCYAGTVLAQSIVHNAHPDQDLYFTECSGGAWVSSFADGLRSDMKSLTIGATRSWARTVIKWNLVLDTDYGPHNGGCANCEGLVTIDAETGTVTQNNFDYYSIGHASKFVRPGAFRIASTSWPYNGLESVAFENPDGSKVLIVASTTTQSRTFAVRWGGRSLDYSLPGDAVATFAWAGEQDEPGVPAPPANVTGTGMNDHVVVTWEFSPLALSYTIERATEADGPYITLASDITIPEYIDADVKSGVTYIYRITAVNGQGASAASAETSIALEE